MFTAKLADMLEGLLGLLHPVRRLLLLGWQGTAARLGGLVALGGLAWLWSRRR